VRTFESQVNVSRPAYLSEHTLNGSAVFPGTGFVEMLIALQDALLGETARPIEELRFHEPLFLPEEYVALRTSAQREPDGRLSVEISSRLGAGDHVVDRRLVTARIGSGASGDPAAGLPDRAERLRSVPTPDEAAELSLEPDDLSAYFRRHGAGYGPTFRTLRQVTRYGGATAVGTIEGRRAALGDFLHPALLAGALQSAAGLFQDSLADDTAFVSVGAERARLYRKPRGTALRSILHVVQREEEHVTADLALFDEDDSLVFGMTGLEFRRVSIAPTALTESGAAHGQASNGTAGGSSVGTTVDLEEWNGLPEDQRSASASAFLLASVAELLSFPDPGEIPDGASFFELGMDSLIAVRLKNAMETAFRIPLDARTIVENPTVDALAGVLVARAAAADEGS
jgi:acyl carrier protein